MINDKHVESTRDTDVLASPLVPCERRRCLYSFEATHRVGNLFTERDASRLASVHGGSEKITINLIPSSANRGEVAEPGQRRVSAEVLTWDIVVGTRRVRVL